MCDESNETGDDYKLLTILLRLCDSTIESSLYYLETVPLMNFTADSIFLTLTDTLDRHKIPTSNILSFTSDTCNCNVMKGTCGGVISKLRAVQPKIIDVNCICQLVNLCVKSAVKTLPLKVNDLY